MGKLSLNVLKELVFLLQMYYKLYHGVPAFKNEVIELIPIFMRFFNLDIPDK